MKLHAPADTLELDLKQQSLALMDAARVSFGRGSINEALLQMDQARQLALQTADAQLKIDALSRVGIVLSRARKLDLAIGAIEDAERIAREANSPANVLFKIWANRGAFLLDGGFLRRATETFDEVIKNTTALDTEEGRVAHLACLTNLIYVCLATGRVRDALAHGEKYLSVPKEVRSSQPNESTIIFEGWYSTALAQSGQHAEARARLAAIRESIPTEAIGSQIQFSIALAVTEVHGGFVDQGVTRLRETVALAESRNLFYAQSLQALTLVLEHIGNIADALTCVERLEKVMKDTARGIVGIEEKDEEKRLNEQKNEGRAENGGAVRAGSADEDAQDGETDEPTNSSIRMLDDRAAQLRIRRFMELAQDERASVLDSIAVASALVDDETGKHCARVELLTYEFCKALNFAERRARLIAAAARMHDLGKVGVPHRILLAPRRLTPMEFEIAKKHVPIGADLLSFSDHEVVKMAKIIAQNHHEKWDGSGYPRKLFEDAIPIEARITSIVDVFDVLTHRRVYKRAWSVEQARDEVEFMSGKNFDPSLVNLFLTQVVKPDYVIPTEFPNERRTPFDLPRPAEVMS